MLNFLIVMSGRSVSRRVDQSSVPPRN